MQRRRAVSRKQNRRVHALITLIFCIAVFILVCAGCFLLVKTDGTITNKPNQSQGDSSSAAPDGADNGLMRLVDLNPFRLDIRRRLELLERLEEFALCLVRNQLPRQTPLPRNAEHNRAAVAIQERAQRLTGIAALAGRFLPLQHLALALGDEFLKLGRCHFNSSPQPTPPPSMYTQLFIGVYFTKSIFRRVGN